MATAQIGRAGGGRSGHEPQEDTRGHTTITDRSYAGWLTAGHLVLSSAEADGELVSQNSKSVNKMAWALQTLVQTMPQAFLTLTLTQRDRKGLSTQKTSKAEEQNP